MAAEVEDRCLLDDQCALTEAMWSAVSGMLTSYIGFLFLPQEWTDGVKKVRAWVRAATALMAWACRRVVCKDLRAMVALGSGHT